MRMCASFWKCFATWVELDNRDRKKDKITKGWFMSAHDNDGAMFNFKLTFILQYNKKL